MDNDISQSEIYKATKNVIHNDLGITKEYVNDVIVKTVQDEVSKMLNDSSYIEGLIEGSVLRSIRKKDSKSWQLIANIVGWIDDEVTNAIVQDIKDRLEIKLLERK